MPSLEDLLKKKNSRLSSVPLELQTVVEKEQSKILNGILEQLSQLEISGGKIKINTKNIKIVSKIADDLKSVFLTEDYLEAVKEFASEFESQALINDSIVKKTLGESPKIPASEAYIETAKRSSVESLIGTPAETNFIKPIQSILENAVVSGSSVNDTIDTIRLFVEGNEEVDSRISKYVKQITNDTFAISDRSYTSILSEALDNDWYYYSGSEVDKTRCFCEERVGNYYHYKEVESWGRGENLGKCDIGDGKWAGQIPATNESTIYSYLGGYNCMHSLIPVSEAVVPEKDMNRARSLGYIE